MKLKTVEDIMATEPCKRYSREIVADFVGDGITAGQLVKLDIPRPDVLWALIHVWLSPREQRQFAAECAERALLREREAGREPDRRAWEAVRVSRAYADGDASPEELAAARAAGAAGDAAGAAAWAARAAGDAAWAAGDAWAAAWAAELEWQINQALTMTEKEIKIQKIKEAANQVVMNEKEQEAQRRSFAFGNAKIENEFVTKEMIDKVAKDEKEEDDEEI